MLELARRRGVCTIQGLGEQLPFRSSSIGGVLVAFTICFVRDPAHVLGEISRVLIPGGGLVLGFLPRGTPWAEMYARRGAEHHPIYETARFYTAKEVEDLILRAGLRITDFRSTLLQPPGLDTYASEEPTEKYRPEASFLAVAAST
jgi:ubiquinone/menaquinone biosynthesis C-methylase UbiE